jgi:hypothetical protein
MRSLDERLAIRQSGEEACSTEMTRSGRRRVSHSGEQVWSTAALRGGLGRPVAQQELAQLCDFLLQFFDACLERR